MQSEFIHVLLVEAECKFTRFVRESLSTLSSGHIGLDTADTLTGAVQRVQATRYDAVLLDLFLPDSKGIGTFSRLHAAGSDLPIVILTCCENESLALEAVRQGAQDYLVKSKVDGKILSRVVRYAIERKRTELELVAANAELLNSNRELARSEEALRRALDEIRASHERLKSTQLQLIQAAKMESIGTLAAGVAHEVKNPLQTILMGLNYLSENVAEQDGAIGMVLAEMRDGVRRADAIVRDLLHLSESRPVELASHDVNAVLDHSLALVNFDLIRSRVAVVRRLAKELPPVRLDKAKMEQVFINLFMNAIQAMPGGGELRLQTKAARARELEVKERTAGKFQPTDPVVVIEIEDTGPGIPKEKLSRLFEPFVTTKASGLGTGLGLPVSKQIVDLHGGAIDLGSGFRGGARATLILKAERRPP